jgi:hypothetical protein
MSQTAEFTHDFIDVREAAALLGCGVHSIRTALRDGRLKGFPVNGRGDLRTTRAWLREFADAEAAKLRARLAALQGHGDGR